MARFFPLGLILLIFSSCLNEPDCVVTASNIVRLKFIHLESDTSILIDSIQVSGTQTLFYEDDSVATIDLPVDPTGLETRFQIYYDSAVDFIQLSYSRKAQVISPACGAFTHFEDLKVLSSSFGDITVDNAKLSTSAGTNLTIRL